MTTTICSAIFHSIKRVITASSLCVVTGLSANSASALVLDFDDLHYDPSLELYDQPLDNQYAAYGIKFSEAFLVKDESTGNQSAFGLGGFVIDFTGANLPTHISLSALTESDEGLEIYTYGAAPGSVNRVLVQVFDPAVELMQLSGISQIYFSNIQPRSVMGIDNLTLDYASVPEPIPLALLSLGLVGMGGLRKMKARVL